MADLFRKVWAVAVFLWDFIIPRFITEDVALRYVGDDITTDFGEWSAYEISCCMADVEPYEVFDAVATVDAFQILGFGITYRIGNFRAWPADSVGIVNRAWQEATRGVKHG